ncbi:ATP-dependent RNA helicase DBP4 [Tolypocladium ophioglossoides CBS 100239]|uniref:ATP-dependent RNA helicase DBP4 n=1 Tax=Tolypocladium ophioglossoides (strain CBS 100239) TaxID=1163406 RepID=A0A0L0NEQ8_TOLOC|nr:ATP-dependent RNA helicase DBP4 [Tolypocladium ophioglossoides CBS 100239]
MCFQNPDLKYLGQKAFISYSRAIHLQKDKEIFKLNKLDLDGFAAGMGLPGTPHIKFQKGQDIKKIKNAPRDGMSSGSESDMDLDGDKPKKRKGEVRTKYDKMFERQNQDVLSSHYSKLVLDAEKAADEGDDSDDDFLAVKRRLNDDDLDNESKKANLGSVKVLDGLGGDEPYVIDSKRREKALQSKKKMLKFKGNPSKLVFDDDGNSHEIYELQDEADFKQQGPADEQRQKFVESESARVREADLDDKQLARQKKREKREKRKAREALERDSGASDGDEAPRLAGAGDGDGDPLALLRSLPVAGADEDGAEPEPPRKRARKWFEDASDYEKSAKKANRNKKGGRVFEVTEEPETLEDLEALATGLLEGHERADAAECKCIRVLWHVHGRSVPASLLSKYTASVAQPNEPPAPLQKYQYPAKTRIQPTTINHISSPRGEHNTPLLPLFRPLGPRAIHLDIVAVQPHAVEARVVRGAVVARRAHDDLVRVGAQGDELAAQAVDVHAVVQRGALVDEAADEGKLLGQVRGRVVPVVGGLRAGEGGGGEVADALADGALGDDGVDLDVARARAGVRRRAGEDVLDDDVLRDDAVRELDRERGAVRVAPAVDGTGGAPAVAGVGPGLERGDGRQGLAEAGPVRAGRVEAPVEGVVRRRRVARVDGGAGADGEVVDLVLELGVPVRVDLALGHGLEVDVGEGAAHEAVDEGRDLGAAHAGREVARREVHRLAHQPLEPRLQLAELGADLGAQGRHLAVEVPQELVARDEQALALAVPELRLEDLAEALVELALRPGRLDLVDGRADGLLHPGLVLPDPRLPEARDSAAEPVFGFADGQVELGREGRVLHQARGNGLPLPLRRHVVLAARSGKGQDGVVLVDQVSQGVIKLGRNHGLPVLELHVHDLGHHGLQFLEGPVVESAGLFQRLKRLLRLPEVVVQLCMGSVVVHLPRQVVAPARRRPREARHVSANLALDVAQRGPRGAAGRGVPDIVRCGVPGTGVCCTHES